MNKFFNASFLRSIKFNLFNKQNDSLLNNKNINFYLNTEKCNEIKQVEFYIKENKIRLSLLNLDFLFFDNINFEPCTICLT